MRYHIRLIEDGKVTRTGTMEADTYMDAWSEAHPELMDPIVQCARGEAVRWIELTPSGEGINNPADP